MSCAIAMFDLSFGDHHSFAFAEVLSVPLMAFKPILQDLSNEFVYSALPSYNMYAHAIVDVIEFSIGSDRTPREQVAIVFEGKVTIGGIFSKGPHLLCHSKATEVEDKSWRHFFFGHYPTPSPFL